MNVIEDWIQHDINLLKQEDNISDLNYNLMDGCVHVTFDLEFHRYSRTRDVRIKFPEKVKLLYENTRMRIAPDVLSDRYDFPRDLPHLNPVRDGDPVSICLWRKGGTKTLYKQKGVLDVVSILADWFVDASKCNLNSDGWEPSPRASAASFHMDIPRIQKLVAAEKNSNSIQITKGRGFFQIVNDEIIGLAKGDRVFNKQVLNKKKHPKKKDKKFVQGVELKGANRAEFKILLAIPSICHINSYHHSKKIKTLEDLKEYGGYESLSQLLDEIEYDFSCSKKEEGVVVLVVHRRPVAIIKDIPGLSNEEELRKIEISSFFIRKFNNEILVYFLSLKSEINARELGAISGCPPIEGRIGIIGCGSLGSSLADQLARSGYSDITLWDQDYIEAHNTARHILIHSILDISIFDTKSSLIGKHLKLISKDHESGVEIKKYNFSLDEDRETIREAMHIIDASANDLDYYWHNYSGTSVSRVYISDEGRIGIIQTQPKTGTPDMLDLDAFVYMKSLEHQEIREWLGRQSTLGLKMVGLNCSSETLELSWSSILNHTSALIPALKSQFKKPRAMLAINVLNKDGFPVGFKIIGENQELEFLDYQIKDIQGVDWKVTISPCVLGKIESTLQNHKPNEAGGYLFGLFNIETHRISIVFCTEGRFNSSPAELELSPIKNDTEAQEIMNASNNMLVPMGTWHTHPNSNSNPSDIDLETLASVDQLIPFVMLIKGKDGLTVLISYKK